jgi:hypothetical protein
MATRNRPTRVKLCSCTTLTLKPHTAFDKKIHFKQWIFLLVMVWLSINNLQVVETKIARGNHAICIGLRRSECKPQLIYGPQWR